MPAWLYGHGVETQVGSNDANNKMVTDLVAGNPDGSVYERLEALMGGYPTGYHPTRGFRVTKSATIASAPDALFDVTGLCEITLMIGLVTSAIATSTSMSINTSTNDQVISASTQITTDAIGNIYVVSGDVGLGFSAGGTPGVDAAILDVGTIAPFFVNNDQIEQNVNTAGTGLIDWTLFYWPLASGASVAAAA